MTATQEQLHAAATTIARARARLLTGGGPDAGPVQMSLPSGSDLLFTHDQAQLHDLIYHAVTLDLRKTMNNAAAHEHAARIAAFAMTLALASDHTHHGTRP